MNTKANRLLLFPGLGADKNLFHYQLQSLANQVVVPKWITPKDDESLSEYCARWAKTIDANEDDCIGGMSFGGQVALEIARHRPFKKVILISANRRASEISGQFKLQNSLLKTLPDNFVKMSLRNIAIPKLAREESLKDNEQAILNSMVENMDFKFFRWASNAVASWDYEFNPKEFKTPIVQIHGEHDSIIQTSKPSEIELIKDAGHLINFTHSKELNLWIESHLQA